MERFIGRVTVLSIGLHLTDYLIRGFYIVGVDKEYWFNFIFTILIFYVFSFAILPVLKIITLPITFISFGLFYLVLIIGCVKLLDDYVDIFVIEGPVSLIAVSAMVSIFISLAKNL
jgi:uncharacterized membrane protein YvlD (DUF360 family)